MFITIKHDLDGDLGGFGRLDGDNSGGLVIGLG